MPAVRSISRFRYRQMSLCIALFTVLGVFEARAQSLDAALSAERDKLKAPAVSVAIMEKEKTVYARAFGLADVEQGVAATPETRFRMASVAKPLTATAVMQLVERGAIDLDAPIQQDRAAFPRKSWPVTARQLLAHTAGIRHYTKRGESTGTEHFFTITDSLKLFANDPLLFEPGTKHSYTTYGYSVLGCAIEGAAGMPYGDYMRTRVFEPAGMTHTTLDDVYLVIPQRARGYFLLDQASFDSLPPAGKAIARVGGVFHASLHDTSMKIPGGGLVSTPSDLMKFAAALLQGRLLKPDTLKAMWTEQKTSDGQATGYALGWGVRTSGGRMVVSHSGNQAGAASLFSIDTTNHLALAVMSNLEDANLADIRNLLIKQLSSNEK